MTSISAGSSTSGLPTLKMSDGPIRASATMGRPRLSGGIGLAATLGPGTCRARGRRHRAGRARPRRPFHARAGRQHLSLAYVREKFRILRRRSVSRLAHRRRLHRGHAEPGRERDHQAFHGQQPGVPAPRRRLRSSTSAPCARFICPHSRRRSRKRMSAPSWIPTT